MFNHEGKSVTLLEYERRFTTYALALESATSFTTECTVVRHSPGYIVVFRGCYMAFLFPTYDSTDWRVEISAPSDMVSPSQLVEQGYEEGIM
jgi:hypothetical protein